MTDISLIDAVRDAMREEMAADSLVIVIGQDIGVNGGVFRVTEGFYDEFGPDRVIDSPLA
jgi:pyruvate/2-oxoglutarate/acetoin dehydrogenase E1 component